MLKQKTWGSFCLLLGFYSPPIKFTSEKNPSILVGYFETRDGNDDMKHTALFSLSAQLFHPREYTRGSFTPRTERGHLNSSEALSSGRLAGSELSLSGSSHSTCEAPKLLSTDLAATSPAWDRHHASLQVLE